MAGGRNVIVAVDDNEVSAYSFTWALTNFLKQSDRVLILTAQSYMPASSLPTVDIAAGGEYAVPVVVSNDGEEERLAGASKALVDKYLRQCELAKVPCEGEVVKGDPGVHICEAADRISADVIIVGTHGYGIFKRTLVGSISDYVLHHSPVPVIVVRTSKNPHAHDPLARAGLGRTIVTAVDESNEAAYAFTWALRNLCTEEDKVVILHVQNPVPPSAASIGVDQFGVEEVYVPPDNTNKADVEQLTQSEKLVERYMQYASGETKIRCEGRVVSGPTEDKVCKELVRLEADAVVVGTHNSSAIVNGLSLIAAAAVAACLNEAGKLVGLGFHCGIFVQPPLLIL